MGDMKRIVLKRACDIPAGGLIYPSGTTCLVTEEVYRQLEARGVLADGESKTVGAPAPVVEDEPEEVDTLVEDEPETAPAPAAKGTRPARTAPIESWRAYAKGLGIKTTGLNKQQLQDAVDQLEG